MNFNLKNITFKYGFISIITGTLIFIYTNLIFNYVEDKNIGERFKISGFFQSDLFFLLGSVQISLSLRYFFIYFKGKFYLIEKATIRTYWFTIPLILNIILIPILDRHYPTSKYGNTFVTKVIDFYFVISSFLFFIGLYYFIFNFIKSVYAYSRIRKGWNK